VPPLGEFVSQTAFSSCCNATNINRQRYLLQQRPKKMRSVTGSRT
jgi:hypothetical protein